MTEPRIVEEGVFVVRRRDVLSSLHKVKRRALDASRLARKEGRDADVQRFLARMRAADELIVEMNINVPVFAAPARTVEIARLNTQAQESAQ